MTSTGTLQAAVAIVCALLAAADGSCTGTPSVCDDGIGCTSDACVNGTCVYTEMDSVCDDGLWCSIELCLAGVGCVYGELGSSCDDDNPCTVDYCHPLRACVHVFPTRDYIVTDGGPYGCCDADPPIDTDGDGTSDCDEVVFGTSPLAANTLALDVTAP